MEEILGALRNELGKLEDTIERLDTASNVTNTSNISINAGGVGIVVLMIVSAFVLGIAVVTAFSTSSRMNSLERRQDRQDDYIQTIYRYAPEIPKPTKEK